MPVNSKCREVEEKADDWRMLTDVKEGEGKIKNAGSTYLPELSGQSSDEYDAYKARGTFFNAFARTVQGLTGAAMRKDVQYVVGKDLEPYIEDMTFTGLGLNEVARVVVEALLTHGYFGILVDNSPVSDKPRPYAALYEAVDILNVRVMRTADGVDKVELLVLNEKEEMEDADDRWRTKEVEQVRVFRLDEFGFVYVQIWRKDENGDWVQREIKEGVADFYPQVLGRNITTIPFQFFGAMENSPFPQKPPLLDLAYLNVKHWQVTVDYFHGLHFCALPTPWAAGFKTDEILYIGCTKAWVSEHPEARAGFLEFTGQGIAAIEKALERLEHKMAVMGARMLEEQKRAVEAADTIRLRQSGDTATLSNIADNAEKGLQGVLRMISAWLNREGGDITVELNKDFVSSRLAAADILALLKSYVGGAISHDTFLYNLQQGEVLPGDRTIKDEKALIDAEPDKEFTGEPGAGRVPGEEEEGE